MRSLGNTVVQEDTAGDDQTNVQDPTKAFWSFEGRPIRKRITLREH